MWFKEGQYAENGTEEREKGREKTERKGKETRIEGAAGNFCRGPSKS
jgi:hypothetical protein